MAELHLDPGTLTENLTAFIGRAVEAFRRAGAIVVLSGGTDSAVVATLAARALGPERVLGLIMPERGSEPRCRRDALRLARSLGIHCRVVNLTVPLALLGVYRQVPLWVLPTRCLQEKPSVRWAIGSLVLMSSLSLALTTLVPGLPARVWGVPVEYVAYLAVPGGLGFGLGVWLVGRRGRRLREEAWGSTGLLLLGTGLALLPTLRALQGPYVLLFLPLSVGLGISFALVIVPARTVVQERSPDEVRGRVLSTQLFLSNLASTLPLHLTGGLADLIGFRRIFALLALVVLGTGAASVRHARG